ncbi:MAG: L-histidine N(alpha)-methyltransferase [Acidobacteriaceae bacterium]
MTPATSISPCIPVPDSANTNLLDAPRDAAVDAVRQQTLRGLTATPKTLPPWLFYDQHGSDLFDRITELPEYYLTRTERSILATHANDILREFLLPGAPSNLHSPTYEPFTIAELGAGSAAKTGLLLQAAIQFQPQILYRPIDVSPTAMAKAADALTASIPGVSVIPQVANFVSGSYTLHALHPPSAAASTVDTPAHPTPPRRRTLVLFIGSSIGNFSPGAAENILARLRSRLQPKDALLLGADLAPSHRKPVSAILSAYNDAAGVTAAFNRNILTRLNRELGANFVPESFLHRARWNTAESRIEMHLHSRIRQTVEIPAQDQLHRFHFAADETIHTENSYKFRDGVLNHLLARTGFTPTRSFYDSHRTFCLTLAHAR